MLAVAPEFGKAGSFATSVAVGESEVAEWAKAVPAAAAVPDRDSDASFEVGAGLGSVASFSPAFKGLDVAASLAAADGLAAAIEAVSSAGSADFAATAASSFGSLATFCLATTGAVFDDAVFDEALLEVALDDVAEPLDFFANDRFATRGTKSGTSL